MVIKEISAGLPKLQPWAIFVISIFA